MMMFRHIVLIAIGIANISAIDVTLNDHEVASIVEEAPRNLRGVVTDTTTTAVDDSDASTEAVDWLDAAHRMLKKKNKFTAAQKKAKQLAKKAKLLAAAGGVAAKKKNNGKKNNGKKNNGEKNNGKKPTQLNSERAECTDRGNKKWCTNEVRAIEIGLYMIC